MRNQRGQALIEFLMIVPVMLIIVMAVFDFGNILYQRYQLENQLDTIVDLYESSKEENLNDYLDSHQLVMEKEKGQEYTILRIKKEITIITPGLHKLLGSPYKIVTTKTIYEG